MMDYWDRFQGQYVIWKYYRIVFSTDVGLSIFYKTDLK